MPTATGTITGEVGQEPDTSFSLLSQDMSVNASATPFSFLWGGSIVNTGDVAQVYTVNAVNLSANINSVALKVGGSNSNTRTLQPGESMQVVATVDVQMPPVSDPGQPANTSTYSFDIDQTTAVV